jgi:quinol monooxygenase YgiN
MSIGVVVDFKLKADSDGAARMKETMRERLPAITRKADGCEFVNLYADPADPSRLILPERWESRAKYEKYREWAMTQPGSNEMMSMVARDPVWTYLDDTGV